MTSIILIESNGTVKSLKAKDLTIDTLYKKAGYRSKEKFDKQHTWAVQVEGEQVLVSLYAKLVGKANFENKFEFPPPVDKDLYYGTCVLINTDAYGNILNLTTKTWDTVYQKLFCGFEELGGANNDADDDDDDDVEDEYDDDDDDYPKTKEGYIKDGFVVEEEEDDDEEDAEDDEDDARMSELEEEAYDEIE
jgi:hypothetical protein